MQLDLDSGSFIPKTHYSHIDYAENMLENCLGRRK